MNNSVARRIKPIREKIRKIKKGKRGETKPFLER
jgi:hypothetical protein